MNQATKNVLKKINKYITYKRHNKPPTGLIIKDGEIIIKTYKENNLIIKDIKINDEYINQLVQLVCFHSGENFDESNPIIKTNIPHTLHRFTAIHKLITGDKLHSIVLRIQSDILKLSLSLFTQDETIISKIKNAIKKGSNILVSGGTGSGKTTLLNSMIELFPNQRIVTIENSLEIKIPTNITSSQQLVLTSNKKVNVTYSDLINVSMRLDPERIIIGEIDIENTSTYLRMLNTGHKGVYTTIHGSNAFNAMLAIESNLKIGGNTTPQNELFDYIGKNIDYILQINHFKIEEFKTIEEIREEKK